jgi:DNA-binding NarL/FixJ family response regulator
VNIYLIDDHQLVREWLGNLIKMMPGLHVIGEASDGAHLLDLIGKQTIDLIIVDLSLKKGSGLDIIAEVKKLNPQIKVIALTMHEEAHMIRRAVLAGVDGYVTKQEASANIITAIEQVSRGAFFGSNLFFDILRERISGVNKPIAKGSEKELLSNREYEVFRRIGMGQTTRKIAEDLSVSIKTVQEYQSRIKAKLGIADSAELVRAAIKDTDV